MTEPYAHSAEAAEPGPVAPVTETNIRRSIDPRIMVSVGVAFGVLVGSAISSNFMRDQFRATRGVTTANIFSLITNANMNKHIIPCETSDGKKSTYEFPVRNAYSAAYAIVNGDCPPDP
jgi:hypothetical protein